MVKFEIEFEVYCDCGEELTRSCKVSSHVVYHTETPIVTVDPCSKCLAKAGEDAVEDYKHGVEE